MDDLNKTKLVELISIWFKESNLYENIDEDIVFQTLKKEVKKRLTKPTKTPIINTIEKQMKTKNTPNRFLAEIVLGTPSNPTKVTRVHQIVGLDKTGTPKLKRVDARTFSRGLNNSRLVIS
jgi:hypothetical protein